MKDTSALIHSQYSGPSSGHICNCMGCCKLCGSCITAPWHVPAYCQLLQRQAEEREHFLTYGCSKDRSFSSLDEKFSLLAVW